MKTKGLNSPDGSGILLSRLLGRDKIYNGQQEGSGLKIKSLCFKKRKKAYKRARVWL